MMRIVTGSLAVAAAGVLAALAFGSGSANEDAGATFQTLRSAAASLPASTDDPSAAQIATIRASIKTISQRMASATTLSVSPDYAMMLAEDAKWLAAAQAPGSTDRAATLDEVSLDLKTKADFILKIAGASSDWIDTVTVTINTKSNGAIVGGYQVGCNPYHLRAQTASVRWPFGQLSSGTTRDLPAGYLRCYAFKVPQHELAGFADAEVGHDGSPLQPIDVPVR